MLANQPIIHWGYKPAFCKHARKGGPFQVKESFSFLNPIFRAFFMRLQFFYGVSIYTVYLPKEKLQLLCHITGKTCSMNSTFGFDVLYPSVATSAASFNASTSIETLLDSCLIHDEKTNETTIGPNCTELLSTIQTTFANKSKCHNQEYYKFSYALIGTLFQSIIFVAGVLGNVLVCAVVYRTRSMHTTTNCYLVSLAMADTITLVASVPQEILSYHILGDQWVWGSVGCSLMIFLQYLGIDASALSLTAFTVERYIAICHPIKSKSICRVSRAKKIIIGCWLFAILYCSPWLYLATTAYRCVEGIGEITRCTYRFDRKSKGYMILFVTDIMLFYLIPLLLSVVLYSLIAKVMLSKDKNKFPGEQHRRTSVSANCNQSRVQVISSIIQCRLKSTSTIVVES